MALKYFEYGDKRSSNYGIKLLDVNVYDYPERNMDTFSIPGRYGDIIVDNESFKNIVISYHVLVDNNAKVYFNGKYNTGLSSITQALKGMLYRTDAENIFAFSNIKAKYLKLYDTYDPEYYRLAYFAGPANWETMINTYGECTLEFVAKPVKYPINYYTQTQATISNGTYADMEPTNPLSPRPEFAIPPLISDNKYYPYITIQPHDTTSSTGTIKITPQHSSTGIIITPGEIYAGITPIYVDCYEEQTYVGSNLINNKVQFVDFMTPAFSYPSWNKTNDTLRITNNLGVDATVKIDWRAWTL